MQDDIFVANSTFEMLAPQNQFQELKAGLFLKFKKWNFSFTEVIGSGFQEANKSSNSPY